VSRHEKPDDEQKAAPAEGGTSEHVIVCDASGNSKEGIMIKIEDGLKAGDFEKYLTQAPALKLSGVMQMFAKSRGLRFSQLRFYYNQELIDGEQSAQGLGMQDGDTIICYSKHDELPLPPPPPGKVLLAGDFVTPQMPQAPVPGKPGKVVMAAATRPAAADPDDPRAAKQQRKSGSGANEDCASPGGSASSSVPQKVNLMHLMRAPLLTLVIVALPSHTLLTSPLC
jgi:hypothetical protein